MSHETPIFQLEIPKRSPSCMHGNETLSSGMEYYSILLPDEEKGYLRHDFCLSCWENVARNRFLGAAKMAWKAKIVSVKEEDDLSVKTRDEKAFSYLKEALQHRKEEEWTEIFVLALYLTRRKILYLRQELLQEDGSMLCIYEVSTTEETLLIKRGSLKEINIEEIQKKIAQKLTN